MRTRSSPAEGLIAQLEEASERVRGKMMGRATKQNSPHSSFERTNNGSSNRLCIIEASAHNSLEVPNVKLRKIIIIPPQRQVELRNTISKGGERRTTMANSTGSRQDHGVAFQLPVKSKSQRCHPTKRRS